MSSFQKRIGGREGPLARRYEYENGELLAADFGVADGTVEVVDGTVVVVAGDDQYEFEVPAGETASASMNNGVLTVEVRGA